MSAGGPGPVAWLTGLPSSGKSTLAARVAQELRARGHLDVVVLERRRSSSRSSSARTPRSLPPWE